MVIINYKLADHGRDKPACHTGCIIPNNTIKSGLEKKYINKNISIIFYIFGYNNDANAAK